MIGRKSLRQKQVKKLPKLKGFDDFDICLGDMMRGERATLGKSLLDVQNELKIKATYISAVEDSNSLAFDTPGFIAGYVRSYAKYLGMDPEIAFELFCKESGFKPTHGMSRKASSNRLGLEDKSTASSARPFSGLGGSKTSFMPPSDNFFESLDIKAILASLVLIFLLGGLGFGSYSVVQKIQRVEVMPIEYSPLLVADIDPLFPSAHSGLSSGQTRKTSNEIYSRIYRPQALDTPILTPRDGTISSLNPNNQGIFSFNQPSVGAASSLKLKTGLKPAMADKQKPWLQVVAPLKKRVQLVAEKGVWLRVKNTKGTVIYEQIMDSRDPFDVPLVHSPSVIERAGNSGSLFFLINGQLYGPAGNGTSTVKNIELSPENLIQTYDVYSPKRQSAFYSFLRDLEAGKMMQ